MSWKRTVVIAMMFLMFHESALGDGGCAVVTLFYPGDGFVHYVETLGYSLLSSKTTMKMISLTSREVREHERKMARRAGWEVMIIDEMIRGPAGKSDPHFELMYSKLLIFNMTGFNRVVYLDADTQVLENVDELCSCAASFSVVVRNSVANAGVMVVKPSTASFEYLVKMSKRVRSYDGGDQGFFNAVFRDLDSCPYDDPKRPHLYDHKKREVCFRLPARYNGDIALFSARGRWLFGGRDINRTYPAIIHYTMGRYLKPWNWMSYLAVPEFYRWWAVYDAHREIGFLDCVEFLVIPAGVFAFWFWLAWRDFKISFLNDVIVHDFLGSGFLNVAGVKILIAHVIHGLAVLCVWNVCSLIMIDPSVNATLAVFVYCSFYEFLCIHFTHYLIGSMVINHELADKMKPHVLLEQGNTAYCRLVVYSSTAMLVFSLVNTPMTIYTRAVMGVLWVLIVPGVTHTSFIVNNYV